MAGADDLEQLRELSEEEFAQLSTMIGMDKKPFHVLRFRKALEKPPPPSGAHLQSNRTTTSPHATSTNIMTLTAPTTAMALPTSNYFTQAPSQAHLSAGTMLQTPPPVNILHHPPITTLGGVMASTDTIPHTQPGQPSRALLEALSTSEAKYGPPKITMQQPDPNRPKPCLPPYLMPNSECRTFDDLVDEKTPIQNALGPPPFTPSVWDPDRKELIRKYSTIYGKNCGDRRQKDVLSDFEAHINEAALQLCLRDPTLLARREELYILAKRAVKEGGYAYYHGFSKTKETLNSTVSGTSQAGQKRPRLTDNDVEESNTPPAKLVSLKTALNIPSKLSVKRRLEHMQELENLIAENKSQQAVKLAALERAQQNGDFSAAYSIQLDVESLGMTCEQLQTAYTTLKKRQYRSVRYFKKKQETEDKETSAEHVAGQGGELATTASSITSPPNNSYPVSGTTTVHVTADQPEGPVQLIDASMLFSSPSMSTVATRSLNFPSTGSSSSTCASTHSLSHRNRTKGSTSSIYTRPSPTVTATVIPSTAVSQQQQFDTRTHTVTVTVPSQEDSADSAVRNLVENVSHATDEVNSLMIRELNKQLAWEDLQ